MVLAATVLFGLTMGVFGHPQLGGKLGSRLVSRLGCRETEDCDPYHKCEYFLHSGAQCTTQKDLRSWQEEKSCGKTVPAGGASETTIPDHDVCKEWESAESGRPAEYATAMCFPDLGFVCRKAYYMPCTPEYDEEGALVTAEGCPSNFSCVNQAYSGDIHRVCVPDERQGGNRGKRCSNNFECGYTHLGHEWVRCSFGACSGPIEK